MKQDESLCEYEAADRTAGTNPTKSRNQTFNLSKLGRSHLVGFEWIFTSKCFFFLTTHHYVNLSLVTKGQCALRLVSRGFPAYMLKMQKQIRDVHIAH